MKYFTSFCLFICLLFCQTIQSQVLFVEDVEWGKEIEKPIPDDLQFTFVSSNDSIKKGETADIQILYLNGNVAIEGQVLHSKGKLMKSGTWNYYYDDGKLWSVREYKKLGKLTNILKLLSKEGEELPKGFGRYIGKYQYLTGYNYRYGQNGEKAQIIQYSGGLIINTYPLGSYTEDQLSRVKIRTFEMGEDQYLEELSFEEAFEKQKVTGKTILLNASTNWNGWTKRGYKKVFTIPEVAKFIDDNFIFAYLDIEDTKPIELEVDGEKIILEGSKIGKPHQLIEKTVTRLSSTPTFIFLGPNLEVLHINKGIEVNEEKFMQKLLFFTTDSYQSMTFKEFSEQ